MSRFDEVYALRVVLVDGDTPVADHVGDGLSRRLRDAVARELVAVTGRNPLIVFDGWSKVSDLPRAERAKVDELRPVDVVDKLKLELSGRTMSDDREATTLREAVSEIERLRELVRVNDSWARNPEGMGR